MRNKVCYTHTPLGTGSMACHAGATLGLATVSQEVKGVTGACGPEPVLWFPWEGSAPQGEQAHD